MRSFKSFITEKTRVPDSITEHLDDFIQFACDQLGLDTPPLITLINDKKLAMENKSFGGYHPASQEIRVNVAERHRADVFRTLAHELTHYKQDLEERLDEASGETGSDIENEANAAAGIIMRDYAKLNDGLFESKRIMVPDGYKAFTVKALVHNRVSGKTIKHKLEFHARSPEDAQHLHDLHMSKTPGYEIISRSVS